MKSFEEIKEREGRRLEDEYPFNLQLGITITLVLMIGLFTFVKGLEVHPYSPRTEFEVLQENVDLTVEDVEEPPPPPKPKVEVEEASPEEEAEVEEEEVDIAPTTEFNELEAPPPPVTEETFEFWAVEKKPEVVKRVQRRYPELARRAGIEGQVFVRVLVGEDGRVIRAEIYGARPPEVKDVLGPAALEAARKFVFTPGMQRDKPVKVWVMIPFQFKLQ